MEWERRTTVRYGQAHVFVEDSGAKRSLCGTIKNPPVTEWSVDDRCIKCATCRRKVDPTNAPKAPKWREQI